MTDTTKHDTTAGPPEQPRRFRTILADPPWDVNQKGSWGADAHYPVMTLERIKQMPVAELAEDNAHLWLWVTNATLRHGYDVAEAWGFTVRSPLTWIKFRLGLGPYLRNTTEHLLFATKGRAPVKFKAQPTWFNAPVQDHSHKPEEQYPLIERISDGPNFASDSRSAPAARSYWFRISYWSARAWSAFSANAPLGSSAIWR